MRPSLHDVVEPGAGLTRIGSGYQRVRPGLLPHH